MKLRFRCCCVAALALLAGCATYKPAPLDSQAILQSLDDRQAVILVKPPADAGNTFDPSDGFSERELIGIALRFNTGLDAARSRLGESKSLLIAAGFFPDPEFAGSVRPGIRGTDGVNAEADLMFELLRFGERGIKRDVAKAANNALQIEIASQEYDVATQVRLKLTSVLSAEQELELLNQEIALRKQAADLVNRRRDAGETNALDVAAAEMELAEVERDQRIAVRLVVQERMGLNQLLGLPAQVQVRLTDSGNPIEVLLITPPAVETLEQQLLIGRLDLRQKEAEYERAEYQLRLEVARQYPSLKLGPSFSHEGEGDNYLGLAVALDWPLLSRNRAAIVEKQAQRDRVRAEYVDLLHRLSSDAAAESALVNELRKEVDFQRDQSLPRLDRNARLFRAAFDAREISVLDYITMQSRLLQNRRAYLRLLIEYKTAVIRLDGKTGMSLSGINTVTRPSVSQNPASLSSYTSIKGIR